jgi:diguanylate cyclase (GGDEF)-like protein
LPELQDSQAAADFHSRFGDDTASEQGSMLLPSSSPGGVLYRIPLRGARGRDEDGPPPERRRSEARRVERIAWIGLRYPPGAAGSPPVAAPWQGSPVAGPGGEGWWTSFLSLAAAFAAHARSVSSVQIDTVSGLPDRNEFQAQLEAVLEHSQRTEQPGALLLLGPNDFAWVNDRLDRRSGDEVLREVASNLREALRSHDHVARYGGAIFTVILVEIAPPDAERVAHNLLRRLSEHRYHGGTLRLEFSVGIAAVERGATIDPQELVRRADQALSAAKRGDAGPLRVWRKGSDVERASSLDRLQGIFTGDRAKDYRNMGLLLDSVAVVAASTDAGELARSFTKRLFDTLHARRVGVLELLEGGAFELLGGLERADTGARAIEVRARDLHILERACSERNFVVEHDPEGGDLSLCALPLFLARRCLGGILLEVSSASLSFQGSDRRFLDALASQLALALDRARLTERERQRQREEKERLEAEVKDLRRVVQGSRLAYRSAAMESVLTSARKVARTDTTVLITGESGTGKELLAHTVHALSERQARPLVIVDCGAIAPTLIESELFGYEKGAFTGALQRKLGRLMQADGATVFLDEIGEIPLDLQSKLLRFVQEKQLTPVGGVSARAVDVRIIAATNVDLKARVAEGRFREDLFHRLNVVRLQLPPLRERQEDIIPLASLFLQQFAALYRRPAQRFTPRAEQALAAHAWPGNVRELQNAILNSVLFCDDPEVDLQYLNPALANPRPSAVPVAPTSLGAPPDAEPDGAAEPVVRLRRALAREVAAALASGPALAPLGKWLSEDLILAAERLSGGRTRRAAFLLGLPESTYRRQLRAAANRRSSGQAVRSGSWSAVVSLLEEFIKSRSGDADVCQLGEACLLAEAEAASAGARQAAALLGVTEPTLLRRKTQAIGQV